MADGVPAIVTAVHMVGKANLTVFRDNESPMCFASVPNVDSMDDGSPRWWSWPV
jgi:hypothetical protein